MTRNEINNNIYTTLKNVAVKYQLPLKKNLLVSVHDNNNNIIFLDYARGDKKFYLSSCNAKTGETNYKYFSNNIEDIKIEIENIVNNKVEYYNF